MKTPSRNFLVRCSDTGAEVSISAVNAQAAYEAFLRFYRREAPVYFHMDTQTGEVEPSDEPHEWDTEAQGFRRLSDGRVAQYDGYPEWLEDDSIRITALSAKTVTRIAKKVTH